MNWELPPTLQTVAQKQTSIGTAVLCWTLSGVIGCFHFINVLLQVKTKVVRILLGVS